MRCPTCMKETLETKHGDYLEGKYLIKDTEWEECSHCGEKFFGPKILEELDRAYYVNNDLIFPEDIKYMRKNCGKTQLELADAIGVSENSIKRWEKGSYIQPEDKDKRMREIFRDWESEGLSNLSSDAWILTLMDKSYSAPLALAVNTEGNICKADKEINETIKKIK